MGWATGFDQPLNLSTIDYGLSDIFRQPEQ